MDEQATSELLASIQARGQVHSSLWIPYQCERAAFLIPNEPEYPLHRMKCFDDGTTAKCYETWSLPKSANSRSVSLYLDSSEVVSSAKQVLGLHCANFTHCLTLKHRIHGRDRRGSRLDMCTPRQQGRETSIQGWARAFSMSGCGVN